MFLLTVIVVYRLTSVRVLLDVYFKTTNIVRVRLKDSKGAMCYAIWRMTLDSVAAVSWLMSTQGDRLTSYVMLPVWRVDRQHNLTLWPADCVTNWLYDELTVTGLTKTSRDAGTPWPTNLAVNKTPDAGPAAGTMGPLRNWSGVTPSAPSRQPIPNCLLNVLLLFKWSFKWWFIS